MKTPKSLESLAKPATKGRVNLLYALPYLTCMVYVLQIDGDIFMSLSVIKGQMFQFYLEMKPKKGDTELTKLEIERTLQIMIAGAHTTIEQQMGVEQSDKGKAQAAEAIKVAEQAFGDKGVLN